jgi:hypothetical protein
MSTLPTLRQLNATHDQEQDRILLRLNTTDGSEVRFWITRRFMLLLRQTFGTIADRFAATHTGATVPAATLSAYSEYSREQTVKNSDFQTEYQPGELFPLGEIPILLTRISIRVAATGTNQILSLHPTQGQGIDLNLDENLTHALSQVIESAAIKAEWITPTTQTALPVLAETGTHLLH